MIHDFKSTFLETLIKFLSGHNEVHLYPPGLSLPLTVPAGTESSQFPSYASKDTKRQTSQPT